MFVFDSVLPPGGCIGYHANVKEAWKYVSSDGNIVWKGRLHFPTYFEYKWALKWLGHFVKHGLEEIPTLLIVDQHETHRHC